MARKKAPAPQTEQRPRVHLVGVMTATLLADTMKSIEQLEARKAADEAAARLKREEPASRPEPEQ